MEAMVASNALARVSQVTCGPSTSDSRLELTGSRHGSSTRVSFRSRPGNFWGSQLEFSASTNEERRFATSLPKIEMAISKEKKAMTVERAKKELENCTLIASINYKTFTVKQFQELRQKLPEGTSLLVCKNKLLGKAIEGTPWVALEPAMKGMNAFLFVHTEEIPAALKPYREMQKEQKLEQNDFTGAVFEGKFYGPDGMKALETLPTRAELYSKLLGTLKAPASQLVGTLQAPARELVFTLKAYVAKLEEEQGQAS